MAVAFVFFRQGLYAASASKMNLSGQEVRSGPPQVQFWNRALLVALFIWTFVQLCFPMLDTDFWWHLKTGEYILGGNGIPYVDLYTFTDSDKAWIDLHWGFQVLVTILYRMGGVPLVSLVKAAIYTASIAIAFHAGGSQLPLWKKAAIWIPAIICITGRGNERPEMLSQLFLACWLWIAKKTDQQPKLIWYLPLLQLVWVNCHALFVLGLIVGFCYAVDAVVRRQLNGRFGLAPRTTGPSFHTLWIVAGLVAASCFINPYFEQGAIFPLTLYRKFSGEKEFYSKNIGEFQQPINFFLVHGFTNLYLNAQIAVWAITGWSFVQLLVLKKRWSVFRLVLFAGFSHLAWQASRNTNIFAVVSGFVACENFADCQIPSWDESKSSLQILVRRTKWMTAVTLVLCTLVVSGIWNQIGEKNKPFRLGERSNWFIHDAAKFAAQPGFPERAFVANIGQAEVYVYHNGPQHKVFMDARLEVCTQQTFESFNHILKAMARGTTSWESYFRKGGLPVVILDSRTTRSCINGMLNTPSWRLVFADPSAAVFLPVELANRLNLPMVSPEPLDYPDGPKGKK